MTAPAADASASSSPIPTPDAPLLVLGNGGHATVVIEAARQAGWTILGCVDDHCTDHERNAARVLGTFEEIDDILARISAEHDTFATHAAIGDPELRRRWLEMVPEETHRTIVHPRSIVAPSAQLGRGVFIGAGSIINPRARIGDGCIINSAAIVEHDNVIGTDTHIAPGAALGGTVTVGNKAMVGINACVHPRRRIGDGATVGMGAVVIHDVPPNLTVTGNPARPR